MHGIKKLKSGRWQARYFAGFDSTGKRIYPSKSFLLQTDAIKWRRDRIHEKESGQPIESLELSVGVYLDRWLEIKADRVRPNTLHNLTNACRLYIRPTFESKRLRGIVPMDIHSWQRELLGRVSPRTVNDARDIFSMALNDAVKLRLLTLNPIKATDAPKWERREMKTFNRDQAQTFIYHCGADVRGVLFVTMLMSGLRPEEAQGLCWPSLDLAAGRLRVRTVLLARGLKKWKLYPPKTSKGKREIAINPSLVSRLNEHRKRQLEERLAAGSAYENHSLVFANPIGGPILINSLETHFKKTLTRAELPDMRLYDLRHSFCTLSIAQGIDLKTVSSDMGHASVAFTLDHYGHVLESMREGAAQRREELFGNISAAGWKK